jgi:acetoin utilization protein AcuC
VWAGLTGQRVADEVPLSWLNRWQGESPRLLMDRMRDLPGSYPEVSRRSEIEATNRRALEALRRAALPLLRGWNLGF